MLIYFDGPSKASVLENVRRVMKPGTKLVTAQAARSPPQPWLFHAHKSILWAVGALRGQSVYDHRTIRNRRRHDRRVADPDFLDESSQLLDRLNEDLLVLDEWLGSLNNTPDAATMRS